MQKRKRGRPKLTPEQKAERLKERELKKKERAERKAKSLDTTKLTSYYLTPAGKCPFPLYGSDEEAVTAWLTNFKVHSGTYKDHTCQSLVYWLRDFYSIFSEEFKKAEWIVYEKGPELGFPDMSSRLKIIYKKMLKDIEKEGA